MLLGSGAVIGRGPCGPNPTGQASLGVPPSRRRRAGVSSPGRSGRHEPAQLAGSWARPGYRSEPERSSNQAPTRTARFGSRCATRYPAAATSRHPNARSVQACEVGDPLGESGLLPFRQALRPGLELARQAVDQDLIGHGEPPSVYAVHLPGRPARRQSSWRCSRGAASCRDPPQMRSVTMAQCSNSKVDSTDQPTPLSRCVSARR